MPKGVYIRKPENLPKPRVYPLEVVEAVRRMYLDEGMTVAEVQTALPKGYKAQRLIERFVPERRRAIKRDQRGSMNASWRGDDATYGAVHLRMGSSRGPCVDCGEPATEWSYEGGCVSELGGVENPPYCTHREHYQPRCTGCHRRHDFKGRRPNGQMLSRREVM